MNGGPTYGLLERLLHRLALGSTLAKEVAFDLERLLYLGNAAPPAAGDSPVYVCGLARSGTTILMQTLAQTGHFASATYRSMPFVMAPNLWKRLSGLQRREGRLAERSHGDGLQIDYDSPEAFEEVFWSTYCRISTDSGTYRATEPSSEVLKRFAAYRQLVVLAASAATDSPTRQRYLAKNNNNLLRLPSLCAEQTATVIVAYREPLATAHSLQRMHLRYQALAQADPFTARYMKWLGHHEFGPWHLPLDIAVTAMDPALAPDVVDYWLNYWIAIHKHLLRKAHLPLLLVNHDTLRADPQRVISALYSKLAIEGNPGAMAARIKPVDDQIPQYPEFSAALCAKAQQIHSALRESSLNFRI